MISVEEAQEIMDRFVALRERCKVSNDPTDHKCLQNQKTICMEKFKYLITMRTDRYKNFCNYDDLNQEGFEALIKAMHSYNPSKGSWFWWAHKYIETRIIRSANNHSTIKFPMKFAKLCPPHKENMLPVMFDNDCPERNVEMQELSITAIRAMKFLSLKQQTIIKMLFGFDGDKQHSINKICKRLKISRIKCLNIIDDAINVMRQEIKL